jgi:hydrogenase nickel incorporation protein HypA/HybF
MNIAKDLFDLVMEVLSSQPIGARVEIVHLKIGKLRAIDPENLGFCFKVLSSGSLLERATLQIEEVPVRVKCRHCARENEIAGPAFLCPACGSGNVDLAAGKELEVTSVEIDDA